MVPVLTLRSDWLIAPFGFDVIGHFLDILCLFSFKTVLELILSHENEFELLGNKPLNL